MVRRTAALIAAALASASVATAQPRPELAGPTQGQMNDQAAQRLKIADAQLNTVYRRLMARATPDGMRRLRSAQRLWLQFRNANCDALTGSRDGSVYPTVLTLCHEQMTDARTKELEAQLHCEEGDLGCGGPFE